MTLIVANRRRSAVAVDRDYPGALVLDLTSKGPEPWVAFSPFYPHGEIPVPFTPGVTSQTVEGIWQALKVFEAADVDPSKLAVSSMKGIKRTSRRYGQVLGHREGLEGKRLLPYVEARRRIYLPSYRWVLEHKIMSLVDDLRRLARDRDIVLLDYTTNDDVDDPRTPLSHAALVRRRVELDWPDES
jgi:hypothetical protein